jgi:hypothetical protein
MSLLAEYFLLECPYRLIFFYWNALMTEYFLLECPYWLDIRYRRYLVQGGSAAEALALLNTLEMAASSVVLNADNVVVVIQALSDVCGLRDAFNTTDITRIFELEVAFSEKNLGGLMVPQTGQKFVQALGNILNPDFLDYIIYEVIKHRHVITIAHVIIIAHHHHRHVVTIATSSPSSRHHNCHIIIITTTTTSSPRTLASRTLPTRP